jgi:hypothetical protein
MPTHMREPFSSDELQAIELAEPFTFTKGCRTMKIPGGGTWRSSQGTLLFDLETDYEQLQPITDETIEQQMTEHLVRLMKECDAPPEQYERLGLE